MRLHAKLAPILAASLLLASPGAGRGAEDVPAPGEYVEVDELPVVVESTKPTYPPQAREAGLEGTVVVDALVGTDGRVRDVRVVKSIPALDQAALDAVKAWVFRPAIQNGKPVAVWVAVPVKFAIAHAPTPPPVSEDSLIPVPPPRLPVPGDKSSSSFAEVLEALRARGVQPPSEDDALMRERVIRMALVQKPPLTLPVAARDRLERARRAMKAGKPPEDVLKELAAALNEAPWWADPHRDIARLQEKLANFDDAIVSLELYLVAAPQAADWERVRFDIRRLRAKVNGKE